MSFTIFTDTSANLPTEYVKANGIIVIPFSYFVDEREMNCMDTASFDGETFYRSMREGKNVTTSQINPDRFIEYMEPELSKGNDVLYVGMSSGISGAYNSACIAMTELRDRYPERSIRLIDTRGASLGEGLWVIKAAEMRDEGKKIGEIADLLHAGRKNMYQIFVVDDLKYLTRSGRISGAAATVGTLLNIKPLLKGNAKGQIVSHGKVRGMRKALESIAAQYDALVVDAPAQRIGIAHADCKANADKLIELLNKNNPPREILTVCYEPVTGSHVGPGTLALFFLGADDVREH